MKPYCFGVDLGGTTVKLGLLKTDGVLLEKWEIPTRTENKGAAIIPDIGGQIILKMQERSLTADDIQGIGIGVPGPVLNESIVNRCVNLGWDVVNVADELESLTHLPVTAANDADVAALGEQWIGGGKDYENIVMITLGTGVGGGIIMDGRIVAGRNGSAGEIGHMNVVDPEDTDGPCRCGRVGCLETAGSATGLVRLAGKKLRETTIPSVLRQMAAPSAKDILDAAKAGDELAVMIADKMMTSLAKAAAEIAVVFDPEVFVIGGGVSRAGDFLTEGISERYRQIAFYAVKNTPFVLARLGNDAGIIGAAAMICKKG